MTRVVDQHPDIFPSSPNALIGVFTAVLQSRFFEQTEAPLPWIWDPDPTPEGDDAGALASDDPDAAPPPRRIYIERAAAEHPVARDVRPALLVGRGAIQYIQLGAGNRAHHDYPRSGEALMCHASVPITIACLSRDEGESGTLADVVASYLIGSATDICTAFAMHEISLPSIAEPAVYRRERAQVDFWNTQVVVTAQVRYKWWRWPLAPVIRDFVAHLKVNGEARDLREVLQRRNA